MTKLDFLDKPTIEPQQKPTLETPQRPTLPQNAKTNEGGGLGEFNMEFDFLAWVDEWQQAQDDILEELIEFAARDDVAELLANVIED